MELEAFSGLDNIIKSRLGQTNANVEGSGFIKTLKKYFLQQGVYTKSNSTQSTNPDLYHKALTFHENCIFFCAHYQEFEEFQRHYQRLQYFYNDLKMAHLSSNYDHIQGIYLTYLLSEGKHDDFHLVLESLPIEKHSNPYYQFAILFERDLMIGNFKTALVTGGNIPSKFFGSFLDKFRRTIQQEVIEAIESSVTVMDSQRAFDLFGLKNVAELESFIVVNSEAAEKRGYTWTFDGQNMRFSKKQESQLDRLDAENTMLNMLNYVNEIDKIV